MKGGKQQLSSRIVTDRDPDAGLQQDSRNGMHVFELEDVYET